MDVPFVPGGGVPTIAHSTAITDLTVLSLLLEAGTGDVWCIIQTHDDHTHLLAIGSAPGPLASLLRVN